MQPPSKTTTAAAAQESPSTGGVPTLHVDTRIAADGTPWSTGLFDCHDDVGNSFVTCFCPCVTFGQIAEIVDRGSPSCGGSGALYALILHFTGCCWVYSCFYRTKMRRQYGLARGYCPDGLVHLCCESCALCQEYRELKNRGIDPTLGWQGNVERQGSIATFPPAVGAGGMTR